MKSLHKNDLNTFLERFDNAQGGELVSLEMISPTSFKIALTVQDKARAFDWVNLNLEFTDVSDAKLLDDKSLKAVDMQEGVNISFAPDGVEVGFGSSQYLSSPLHLRSNNVKYEETEFSL